MQIHQEKPQQKVVSIWVFFMQTHQEPQQNELSIFGFFDATLIPGIPKTPTSGSIHLSRVMQP